MATQYWVGDFFVDLSRNQITQSNQSQSGQSHIMAPKALAVLTYLAENQGRVLSQDALLAKVWQDTVVSPNTLQRSIAQLRKALGDDGKGQTYIQTHAKQGYSLECDVRWLDSVDSTLSNDAKKITVETLADNTLLSEINVSETIGDTDSTIKTKPSRPSLRLMSIVAGIIVLGIFGFQSLATRPSSQLSFEKLRSLTATDDKEFDATYTPDGQYIVFHRYLDNRCGNKLWAKNISTQREILLTQDWGDYGSHSFSKDGKKLVFLETKACSEPVTQKDCYDLVSVDFEKALENPQQPSVILQCKNSVVKKPKWLNNNNIALLQKNSNRWKLIGYSISNNTSADLYDLKDGNIIDFAYSSSDDLIAVISIHNDGDHYIEMLKSDGSILSSYPIERPPEIPKFRPIYPNFDPLNKQLVFSTGRQLYTLSYDGKVAKINLPFVDKMQQPEFHPNGKRLLMIKGPYDSDIALLAFNQTAETNHFSESIRFTGSRQTSLEPIHSYPKFERSNLGEDLAIFQPGGELIAFWSDRSGEEQIWISDGNGPRQLTQFPMDTYIRGVDWAADGKSILVNANSVLTQVFLDSNQQSFPMEYSVVQLFQWDSQNNSALLLVLIEGILNLVEYNFNDSEIRVIRDKTVLWAGKSEGGRIIYKDNMGQFWQPGPVEDQRIDALDDQGGPSKSFVINDNMIFAINNEQQLWSYDLHSDSFQVLGDVGRNVDYLTDINQTQLLMKVHVSERKEVVELSVSE